MSAEAEEKRQTLERLKGEVDWLHARWILYRQLYDTSKLRVALLRRSAEHFFAILQRVLLSDVILGICRLTDPAQMGRKGNLVLARLLPHQDADMDMGTRQRLQDKYATVEKCIQRIRVERNQKIAHIDLRTAIEEGTIVIPSSSRKEIEEALNAISSFMNVVHAITDRSERCYAETILNGDGRTLVLQLRRAQAFKKLQSDRTIGLLRDIDTEWTDA